MKTNYRHFIHDWKTKIRSALFGLGVHGDGSEFVDRGDCKPYRLSSPYREHFICLDCRKGFKGIWDTACPKCRRPCKEVAGDFCPDCNTDISYMHSKACPDCGIQMVCVSKDFPVPRKNNTRAWKYISELISSDNK